MLWEFLRTRTSWGLKKINGIINDQKSTILIALSNKKEVFFLSALLTHFGYIALCVFYRVLFDSISYIVLVALCDCAFVTLAIFSRINSSLILILIFLVYIPFTCYTTFPRSACILYSRGVPQMTLGCLVLFIHVCKCILHWYKVSIMKCRQRTTGTPSENCSVPLRCNHTGLLVSIVFPVLHYQTPNMQYK